MGRSGAGPPTQDALTGREARRDPAGLFRFYRRASFVLAAGLLVLLVAHDLALLVALEMALALLGGRLGALVVPDGALAVPASGTGSGRTGATGRGPTALALGVAAVELGCRLLLIHVRMAARRLDVAVARLAMLLLGLRAPLAGERLLAPRLGGLGVGLGPGAIGLGAVKLGLTTDLARLVAARLELALAALAADEREQREQNQRYYDDCNDDANIHIPGLLPCLETGYPGGPGLLGNRHLGELALQHLSGGVAGQLVHEDDLPRHLVARQVLLHVALEVVLARLLALLQYDEGAQALAEVLVLHPHRGRLGHRVVAGEEVLYLLWEHVLAPRDDHLVVAALDEQAPTVVEAADVAGCHQVPDHVLRAAARVALEEHLVADEDSARLPGRHLALLLVEELHDRAARWLARRAGRGAHVGRRCDRRPRHLGRAVEVVEVVAERVHPLDGHVAGQRGAAGGHHFQRRDVVLLARLLRQLEDALHHHRHDDERVATVARHVGQAGLGVELAPQYERGAEDEAEREVGEAPRMEERRGDVRPLSRLQRDPRQERHHRFQRLRVRARGALRGPGRPTRQDGGAPFALGRHDIRGVAGCDQLAEGRVRQIVRVVPRDEALAPLGGVGEQVAELLVVDDRLGLLAAHDLRQLRSGEGGVEVEGVGAQLGERRGCLHEAAVVAAHHRHAVALDDPGVREGVSQRVRALVQLAEGERAELVDDRLLVGKGVRQRDRAGGRAAPPAGQRLEDLHGPVGPHRTDHAGLGQDLRASERVDDAARDARSVAHRVDFFTPRASRAEVPLSRSAARSTAAVRGVGSCLARPPV